MAKFNEIDYQNIIGYWATKILGSVDVMDLYNAYEKEFGKIDWSALSKENSVQIGDDKYIKPLNAEICNNINKLMPKFLWRDVRYTDRPNSPKDTDEELKVQNKEERVPMYIYDGWLKSFVGEQKNNWIKVTCDNGLTFEYRVVLLEKNTYLGEPIYCTIIKTDLFVPFRSLGDVVSKYMPWLHNVGVKFEDEWIDKYRYTISLPHFNPNKEDN